MNTNVVKTIYGLDQQKVLDLPTVLGLLLQRPGQMVPVRPQVPVLDRCMHEPVTKKICFNKTNRKISRIQHENSQFHNLLLTISAKSTNVKTQRIFMISTEMLKGKSQFKCKFQ